MKAKVTRKEKSNRQRLIGLRLTAEEYQKLEAKWKVTTCRKLSDYVRKCLFEKPVTNRYRNESLDEFMIEMIRLRKELNRLGNNLNQAVKKLHLLSKTSEYRDWLIGFEVDRKLLQNKIDQIKTRINQFSDQWLG